MWSSFDVSAAMPGASLNEHKTSGLLSHKLASLFNTHSTCFSKQTEESIDEYGESKALFRFDNFNFFFKKLKLKLRTAGAYQIYKKRWK